MKLIHVIMYIVVEIIHITKHVYALCRYIVLKVKQYTIMLSWDAASRVLRTCYLSTMNGVPFYPEAHWPVWMVSG